MLYIPKGEVKLGSELAYPDEINFGAQKRKVKGFWIDQTEVTVAQFASFIAATHYITDAEKQNEAAIFEADEQSPQQWWKLKSGYNWRLPEGPEGPPARANEAVRYITKTMLNITRSGSAMIYLLKLNGNTQPKVMTRQMCP